MAHVTLWTIRYYDKQNILKSSYVTETGASIFWNGIKSSRLICEKSQKGFRIKKMRSVYDGNMLKLVLFWGEDFMDKMSIYWLVIMAVLIFSIRSLKLCWKKDIVAVKTNERIKNIFEKMINKKRYVFVGMCFLWIYFAGGWTSVF